MYCLVLVQLSTPLTPCHGILHVLYAFFLDNSFQKTQVYLGKLEYLACEVISLNHFPASGGCRKC